MKSLGVVIVTLAVALTATVPAVTAQNRKETLTVVVESGPNTMDIHNQKHPKIVGCKAMHNNGKGIWLRGSEGAVVEGNLLVMNTLYGIHDDAPTGVSAYVGNGARLNGSGHANNYVGLPPGTPVRRWTLGSAPEAGPAGQLENTSISRP